MSSRIITCAPAIARLPACSSAAAVKPQHVVSSGSYSKRASGSVVQEQGWLQLQGMPEVEGEPPSLHWVSVRLDHPFCRN